MASGVPSPTILPPRSPPSGPRSITQSAANHFEIVLNDQDAGAGTQQSLERVEQFRMREALIARVDPAASANGTVSPSAMPITTSRTDAQERKCSS
jgi:hypothetical protein